MTHDTNQSKALMQALSTLEIKLSKLEQQLHTSEALQSIALQARNEEIAGLKEMIKVLQAQHASALQEIELRGDRLVQLQRSFESSTSWRVTRPLRWAMERLRGSSEGVPQTPPVAYEVPEPAHVASPAEPSPEVGKKGEGQWVGKWDNESQLLQSLGTQREDYGTWVEQFDSEPTAAPTTGSPEVQAGAQTPKISVISIASGPEDSNPAMQAVESMHSTLCLQTLPDWEWVLGGSAAFTEALNAWSTQDGRVRLLHETPESHSPWDRLNAAVRQARGEWVVLLDDQTHLRKHALQAALKRCQARPAARAVYADDDLLDAQGTCSTPSFRCEANMDLLSSTDYLGPFLMLRREDLIAIGGWNASLLAGHRHDLLLRLREQWPAPDEALLHVPRVLSHRLTAPLDESGIGTGFLSGWMEPDDPYMKASEAVPSIVQAHLSRTGLRGTAHPHPSLAGACRIRFDLPSPPPRVGIVIPTRDNVGVLSICIESLLQHTTYPDLRVLVVDNGSVKPETLAYLQAIEDPRVKVLRDDAPFNFSRLVNQGAAAVDGDVLCLLNNDMQITQPDWLEEMVGWAIQDGVAAVGARLWYGEGTLQHAGIVLGIQGVAGHVHKNLPKGEAGYLHRAVLHQTMSAVTGACMVVRRSVFDELGGFDEDLGVAYNDVDFCLRARRAGLRNVWTPHAEMIHHESVSRGFEDSPEKLQRFQREKALMRSRWSEWLDDDPAYNPNLTLAHEDFGLAWPPRSRQP
jgi:GT2 family glycosyltransferase